MDCYSEKLAGIRLRDCYESAPPRIKQYLDAETGFVKQRIGPASKVMELGCGYGRVMLELAGAAGHVVGIDTSAESLALAQTMMGSSPKFALYQMNASNLGFQENEFDIVICLQNGICAFHVDRISLIKEALRVTRPGGRVILSSYAERFFPHRLDWFQKQAESGLIGEIDLAATGDGVIACKDGFVVEAMSPADFKELCGRLGIDGTITEIDGSSLICEIIVS